MTDPLASVRAQAAALAAQRAAVIATAAQFAAGADAQAGTATAAAAQANAAAYATATAAATDLRSQRRDTLTGVAAIDAELAALVQALAGDPCDLEADVPLALLPVRLETRYSADGATLRVRIYPDDAHVDRLDRGVSDAERAAGIAYWTAIWAGTATDADAWRALVAAVHPARAAWVAAALSPDLSTRPNPPTPLVLPVLGNPPVLQQLPPVARCLPDRFVVVAVQGETVNRAVGQPVPPTLVVGLPPGSDPADLVQVGPDAITLGPGMRWLVDPVEAEAVGMLVEVPLAQPGAPVDTVFAFGVRATLTPTDGGTELADLLDAHHYATGAALVAPGTPTNNTETDRAAWTRRSDPGQPPTTVPAAADAAGSDATVLAAALGLAPSVLAGWDGANGTHQPLAQAANTTLWQASWGTFIERLLTASNGIPTVSDATREAWRDWWQGFVRGGGPLPLLRLGDQPYGMLPVSSVQGPWQPDGTNAFEEPLLALLRAARPLVQAAVPGLPHVGSADPLDESLLEVLGSAPQQLGLRVRSIGSEAMTSGLQALFGFDIAETNQSQHDELTEALFLQLGVTPVGLRGSVGKLTRPLGLPLVLDEPGDAGPGGVPTSGDAKYLELLRANAPRAVGSVLQALLEICAAREQAAVTAAAPATQVAKAFDLGARVVGNEAQHYAGLLQRTMAGTVSPGELYKNADVLDARFGASGLSALTALQPVVAVRTSLADFALTDTLPANVAEQQAITALSAWFRANARLGEFNAAADALVAAPLGDRANAVAATLDCASHRYDAWVSSLPTRRLASLRASNPDGVLLGAYGWVEGLAPGVETTRPGGYIHAPSLTHAATAGVLRSGYLTHNPDASGSGALAVDLSSARVRSALHLLDGVRQGQPLGALLGYLIERRLHEQHLDVYTLSLRSLAPISAGRLVDRADALPVPAQEAIGANNVVDGVALLALPQSQLWAKLAVAPADNPYLVAADWPVPTAATQASIAAILAEAADAYDAVSDVLLAESVHSLVQGNAARAGAAMAAAAGGDAAPIEPEVVRTPTRAAAITHRVLVLLDDTAPGSGGWSAGTPRALAEPRLAAWAEQRLGPASAIVVSVAADGTRTTLDAAGLSALDVVFDSANARILNASSALAPGAGDLSLDAAVLAARLAASLPGLPAAPLPAVADPAWPAGLRAIGEVAVQAAALAQLLAASTAVTPASFARPNDATDVPPPRSVDASALPGRLTPVVTMLSDATAALTAALTADPVDPVVVTTAVDGLRAFGIALPISAGAVPISAGAVATAPAVLAEAQSRLAAATAALTPFDATAVGAALFGPGFAVLAPVTGAADLFTTVLGALTPGRAPMRRWLRDLATVRPGVARYAQALLFEDAIGTATTLRVAQLAASGTAGTATWLGLPLPAGAASPNQPVTDVVLDAPASYTGAQSAAGFVVDEWVEQLPRRETDGTARITTGLAVNANAPGARAPQAILLAVSPDGNRWSSDALITLLTETRALAGLRGVTLERYALPSPVLPAIQEQSWSLQGEPTLDLSALVTKLSTVAHLLPYVKETGP